MPAAALAAVHLLTPAHMCMPTTIWRATWSRHSHIALGESMLQLRAGVQESLLPVMTMGTLKPEACGRVAQVMELAQDGTKAMGQWLRLELLRHVQQLAVCRNVGVR